MVSVKEILILDQNLRKLVLSKVQLKAVFWEQQEKILQDLACWAAEEQRPVIMKIYRKIVEEVPTFLPKVSMFLQTEERRHNSKLKENKTHKLLITKCQFLIEIQELLQDTLQLLGMLVLLF